MIKIKLFSPERFAGPPKGALREALLRAVRATMLDAVRISREEYLSGPRPQRLGVRSGRLRASVRGSASVLGETVVGVLGTLPLDYARVHELGRGRLEIRPRMKKALKITLAGGRVILRKRALLPPYKGKPYLLPALRDALAGLRARLERELRGILG